MFEPFLMLTVLNCFFMFSSTVTTCALWWQSRKTHKNCPDKCGSVDKSRLKKSKSDGHVAPKETNKFVKIDKNVGIVDNVQSTKREKCSSKSKKKDKDKQFKSTGIQSSRVESLIKVSEEEPETLNKWTSSEDAKRGATSPSSEARSTIVMEVSTVQKLVQIIDNDRDQPKVLRGPIETVTIRMPSADSDKKIECIREKIISDKPHSVEKCDT